MADSRFDYNTMSGEVHTASDGRHYKYTVNTKSNDGSKTGVYRVFYNGTTDFIADPPTVTGSAPPAQYLDSNPAGISPAAPAPDPNPTPAASPSSVPVVGASPDVRQNVQDGNERSGELYKVVHADNGDWHEYVSGKRIWVAKTTQTLDSNGLPVSNGSTGGAQAPDAAATVSGPVPGADPNVFQHAADGSAHGGELYKVIHKDNADIHEYVDGTKISVAKPFQIVQDGVVVPIAGEAPPAQYLDSNPAGVSPIAPSADASSPVTPNPLAQATATHIVMQGESLSAIAHENGLTLAQIVALNPQIENPRLIVPGQTVNTSGPDQTFPVASATDGGFNPPTSSTYPPTDDAQSQSHKELIEKGQKVWGPGAPSPDPAHAAIAVNTHTDTDPVTAAQLKKLKLDM